MSLSVMSAEIRGLRAERPVSHLSVYLASSQDEIDSALALRYQIFAREFGAEISGPRPGIDEDEFDRHCDHLLVRDDDRNEVVGTYRLLTPERAAAAGRYYSAGEFDLSRVLRADRRVLEVGRSCVHPDYRHGGVIALLWSGIGAALDLYRIDFLMGCASVHDEDGARIGALYTRLAEHHLSPEGERVRPLQPLPGFDPASPAEPAELPALLKGYLRVGATIGGEPCWDPAFHAADFFIWLAARGITDRYRRHFADKPRPIDWS
ncbi:MAG: GNAT family N-acetyltransferase [Acidobacteria bacterium]|jgi:putative hemolysin|nr:GNAT family N-acetyltransferase [Acidobacteriota bacterium]